MGDCGCTSSFTFSLVILDYFAFRNTATSSTSDSDDVTNFSVWNNVNIAPLRCMGSLSCGFHLRKKFPDDLLLKSLDNEYDTS